MGIVFLSLHRGQAEKGYFAMMIYLVPTFHSMGQTASPSLTPASFTLPVRTSSPVRTASLRTVLVYRLYFNSAAHQLRVTWETTCYNFFQILRTKQNAKKNAVQTVAVTITLITTCQTLGCPGDVFCSVTLIS